MGFDIRQYNDMLKANNVSVIYSGPIWANGIDGMAEMVLKRLEFEELPRSLSMSVFSIFVEQINNMMFYSAEKELHTGAGGDTEEVSRGVFVLGVDGDAYFLQSGNVVTDSSAAILKERIDHINSMSKQELRQYSKQLLNADDSLPGSKGAGIGLVEIARRSTDPIRYIFEPYEQSLQYFTMYATVRQRGKE
ncbi:MAG: SiaB family protein kinase [Oscillospiraceae bacterium]|jgi:hypothetical protein|nr:SiaB family protein kinase [Oscillospiraceae bacterium]